MTLIACKQKNPKVEIELPDLTMNDGKKWIANKETHIGMTHMDSILKSYKNNTVEDGKTLADALSKETSFIIKSCNMKGEAHDQLHVVLVPMLNIISDLKDEENTALFNDKINSLQFLIHTYFEYFKT